MSGGNQTSLTAHPAMTDTGRLVKIEGSRTEQNADVSFIKTRSRKAQDLKLGQSFTFLQDNGPVHTVERFQEGLSDNSVAAQIYISGET